VHEKNIIKLILFVIVLLSATTSSWAQKGNPPSVIQKPSPPDVNSITQVAVSSGVLTCASRINQVANFLSANAEGVGSLLFIPPANQDQRLISVSMEIPHEGQTPVAYASASFAPNQANGCGGMYESVIYWNQSCDTLAARNFSGLKKIGVLSTAITILDGGIGTKIFLMPADRGCVSIKKDIVQ
jgi:hypothetical protein